MLLSLRLTPKYGRMCASATVVGDMLSMTKGKIHSVYWVPGREGQSQQPLKGEITTREEREAVSLEDHIIFLELPRWCHASDLFTESKAQSSIRNYKGAGLYKAHRAMLIDTACQNQRWDDGWVTQVMVRSLICPSILWKRELSWDSSPGSQSSG